MPEQTDNRKKSKAFLIIIGIIAFFFIMSFVAALDDDNYHYNYSTYSKDYFTDEEDVDDNEPENDNNPDSNKIVFADKTASEFAFYYDDLTDVQQRVYDLIEAAEYSGKTKVRITDIHVTPGDLTASFAACFLDHPELFWIDPGKFDYKISGSSATVYFGAYDYFDYYDLSDAQRNLNSVVDRIVSKAENLDDDFQKALFVHDEILRITRYDYVGLSETEKTRHEPVYDLIRSAYGTLVNGKCVCAGYAYSYKMILDRLGIPCCSVLGYGNDVSDDSRHAWNKIQLGGDGYYIDLTWDDQELYKNVIYRHYFNADTEGFEAEHFDYDINELGCVNKVECTGKLYNYYDYMDYKLDKFNSGKMQNIIDSQKDNKAIYVAFSDYDAYLDAYEACKDGSVEYYRKYVKYYYACNLYVLFFYDRT